MWQNASVSQQNSEFPTGWGKLLLCQRAFCHHDVVTHSCVVRVKLMWSSYFSGLDIKDFTSYLVWLLGVKKAVLTGGRLFHCQRHYSSESCREEQDYILHFNTLYFTGGFCFGLLFLSEPGYVATPIAMVQAAVSLLDDAASLPKR